MTEPHRDRERVTELLGREPRGKFEVVVRDDAGDPVVLKNAPLLDDGTPMPTRYWLVSPDEIRRIGQLESVGGVDMAEAEVDPTELAAAHDRYADERDRAIPSDHNGPRPSGGVGGTRVGVKCLHAHWAWHLSGGDDPIGRWIEHRLDATDADVRDDPIAPNSANVAIDESSVTIRHAGHADPYTFRWGDRALADRWLRDDDPPRPDALTNALGAIDDELDDLVRLRPDITHVTDWSFSGPTITSLATLEAGRELESGPVGYTRPVAEEVFRLVATEPTADRADNPGLPFEHVDVIVATSVIVQAVMRRFRLDLVTLVVGTD